MFRNFFLIIIFITFSSCHFIKKAELSENEQESRNLASSNSPPFIPKNQEILKEILAGYIGLSCKKKKAGKYIPLTQDQTMEVSTCSMEFVKRINENKPTGFVGLEEYAEKILYCIVGPDPSCDESFFDLLIDLETCIHNKKCHLIKENGIYESLKGGNYKRTFIVYPFALPYDKSKINIEIKLGSNSKAYYPQYLSEEVSCIGTTNFNCNIVDFSEEKIIRPWK
ncbi:MAG: hypothetical protein OXC37_06525 [Bdellovibrionaceae bacterium]|nr:hypothetical protein [Pseudobdellovibrionaceae bacterium]